MKDIKKHPMLLTKAARLLEQEHPEFAFTASQLQSMARKRLIPCLSLPTCGTQRKYRHMVVYTELVRHLKNCQQPAIS